MRQTLTFKNVSIFKRNFSGKKTSRYGKEGVGTFLMRLPEEAAVDMLQDGWNVKMFPISEQYPDPSHYISVEVSFDKYPARIETITSRGRTGVPETLKSTLDWLEFSRVDITLNGSQYQKDDGTFGYKAYLKTMIATVEEDELDADYAHIPYYVDNSSEELEQ